MVRLKVKEVDYRAEVVYEGTFKQGVFSAKTVVSKLGDYFQSLKENAFLS